MKIRHFVLLSLSVSLFLIHCGCTRQESAREKTMNAPVHTEISPSTQTSPDTETSSHTEIPYTAAAAPSEAEPFQILENANFLCYADKMHVGTETRTTTKNASGLQIRDTSRLTLNRYGNSVSASVTHEESLTPSGRLASFRTSVSMGGAPIQYEGTLPPHSVSPMPVLSVTVSSQGMTQTQKLAFPHGTKTELFGSFGVEISLLQTPIRLGETREIVRLNPTMLRWEYVKLRCAVLEDLPLPDGQLFPFYRVELESKLFETDGTLSETQFQKETLWCDGKGLLWKRWSPLMELSAWRVSASALAEYRKSGKYPPLPTQTLQANVSEKPDSRPNESPGSSASPNTPLLHAGNKSPDLAENLNIPLEFAKELADETASAFALKAAKAREIVYLVTSRTPESKDPPAISGLFETSAFQKVEVLDPFTLRITVRRSDAERFAAAELFSELQHTADPAQTDSAPQSLSKADTKPTEEDRSANTLIQSSAPEIRALAHSVLPEETDPRKIGFALEKFVWEFIQNKNYARGFVTALEVVQDPSGDCTEHAVLLAALARSRNIPARIAQGLIFEPRSGKMAWHVWNEIYADGHWVPLDATIGRNYADAAHLRINSGSFSSAELPRTLLPAAQLIGKLRITAEAVR